MILQDFFLFLNFLFKNVICNLYVTTVIYYIGTEIVI